MIKLRSGTVFIARSGARVALDLEELQRDLERACRAAGIREPDLPRDVVEIARGVCRRRATHPPSLDELDQLVVQALVDSGLIDVARAFQELRQVPPPSLDGSFLPVDGLSIEDLLSADPWFFSRPVEAIAGRVRQALAQLGLRQVTPALVRQLARHLLWTVGDSPPAQPAEPRYWLVSREELATLVAAHSSRDWAAAGVSFRPVSQFFPRFAIDWDLTVFAASLAQDPLTELILFPAFDAVCRDLALLAAALHAPLAVATGVPAVPVAIALRHARLLARSRLGLASRQADLLASDLAHCLAHRLGHNSETVLEPG